MVFSIEEDPIGSKSKEKALGDYDSLLEQKAGFDNAFFDLVVSNRPDLPGDRIEKLKKLIEQGEDLLRQIELVILSFEVNLDYYPQHGSLMNSKKEELGRMKKEVEGEIKELEEKLEAILPSSEPEK